MFTTNHERGEAQVEPRTEAQPHIIPQTQVADGRLTGTGQAVRPNPARVTGAAPAASDGNGLRPETQEAARLMQQREQNPSPIPPGNVNANPTLWDCIVSYREHMRYHPDEFSPDIIRNLGNGLPTNLQATETEQRWLGQRWHPMCILISSKGARTIRSPGDFAQALTEWQTPIGEAPPGGTASQNLIVVPINFWRDRAALIALLGSQLSIPRAVLEEFRSAHSMSFNNRKFQELWLGQDTLVFAADESSLIVFGQTSKRICDQAARDEYTICFMVSQKSDEHVLNAELKGSIEMLSVLNGSASRDFCTAEGIYLLGRVWLQSFWRRVWLSTSGFAEAPGESDRMVYSKIFKEDKDMSHLLDFVFELKVTDARLKRWLIEKVLLDPDSLEHASTFQRKRYRVEYDLAMKEAQILHEGLSQFTSSQSLRASFLSITESKRGIEEAHAVMRLTQLAFVFLPLTFVTGIFGMNIEPFGGDAPAWQFATSAGTIAGSALLFGFRKELMTGLRKVVPVIRGICMSMFLALVVLWNIIALASYWVITVPMKLWTRGARSREARLEELRHPLDLLGLS